MYEKYIALRVRHNKGLPPGDSHFEFDWSFVKNVDLGKLGLRIALNDALDEGGVPSEKFRPPMVQKLRLMKTS